MDRTYAARYADLYRSHWWWRAREAFVLRNIDRLPEVAGPVLDVGCGDGLLFPALSHLGEVRGVEIDADVVRPDLVASGQVHVGPFDETFRPGMSFGLVLMLDVIEHLEDPVAALVTACRITRPAGWLLVTVPALPGLWTSHDHFNNHHRRYTRRRLEDEVRASGYEIRFCRFFFHWTVGGKLVQRALEALGRGGGPASTPSRPVNLALRLLTSLEQRILTPLHPPIGTSLLLTARRTLSPDEEAPSP